MPARPPPDPPRARADTALRLSRGTDASPLALGPGAPEGSGKTVLLELALTRALLETPRMASAAGAFWGAVTPGERRRVALYVAPTPALARARQENWSARFGPLGVTCATLEDVLAASHDAARVDVFVATPESLLLCVSRACSNEAEPSREGTGGTDRPSRPVMESVACVLLDDCFGVHERKREKSRSFAHLEAALALARVASKRETRPERRNGVHGKTKPLWNKRTTRFASVSAPVSNARELGAWLEARPSDVRAFGHEHRSVPISVEVAGFAFPYAKSENVFERALDEKLADVLASRRRSCDEPALVFCASREGAARAALALASAARGKRDSGEAHPFAFDQRHRASLAAAAARVRDATLRVTLPEGVGVYTTAVSRADREFLEALFEVSSVRVLCCAYAAGVGDVGQKTLLPANLAAPLCVVKGTRRYDGGGAYAEMDAGDFARAFAQCGRAGVDENARFVIMTNRKTADSYTRRWKTGEGSGDPIESRLACFRNKRNDILAEEVNALFARGALRNVKDAEAWFEKTLAGFRYRHDHDMVSTREAIHDAFRTLTELGALRKLRDADDDDSRNRLGPSKIGVAMDDARVTLATMRSFRDAAPVPATTSEVLFLLCGLDEFVGDVALRQNEKKLLREWNRGTAVRFPVTQEGRARSANANANAPAPVVATAIRAPREKLFVLAQACMSDASEVLWDAPERTRLEVERFMARAPASAMAAFATFAGTLRVPADGRFSACFAAARLASSLAARRWDDTPTPLSQFVQIAVAARLADAGIASLDDALLRSPRELERAAGLAPPFGETLLDKILATPPATTVSLKRSALDARGASRVTVRVVAEDTLNAHRRARVTRDHAERVPVPKWYARVLVGCLWKDTLLLEARVARLGNSPVGHAGGDVTGEDVVFERVVELPPDAAPPPGEESSVIAAIVHERCLGRDAHAELPLEAGRNLPASPEIRGTPARSAARRARLETPPSALPRREEAAALAAARVDLTLDSDDDFDAFECDAPPRKAPRVALENVSNR